ncbi:MAG TPA: VIT domain-containing protein, partial [Abditibacteriaceae bacterium]
KVVARVVEKERAAQIYQHITSRMRDPALIEMLNNNTFRARIFPIMPNADLRVEMRYVEVLPTVARAGAASGAVYTYPLKPAEEGKGTLEKLEINVRVKRDAGLTGMGNNLALPVANSDGEYRVSLTQSNFRPKQDLRVGLTFKPQALRASVFAAPSGGRDGFFAVAISSREKLLKPRVHITGIKTYDVFPVSLPALNAGQTVLVTGRYRGSGKATIALSGAAKSARWRGQSTAEFAKVRRDPNLAASLWASKQIESLSKKTRNRARVVALSQRFTLPSKYTSWLAIPEEERQRYKLEKAQADISYYTPLLVREIEKGRGNRRVARDIRSRLAVAAKLIGRSVNSVLEDHYSPRLSDLAYEHVRESFRARPRRSVLTRTRREMNTLARWSKASPETYLRIARSDLSSGEVNEAAARWAAEMVRERPRRSVLRQARRELNRVAKHGGLNAAEYRKRSLYDIASRRLYEVTEAYAREKHSPKPSQNRMAHLRSVGGRIAPFAAQNIEKALQTAEQTMLTTRLQNRASELAAIEFSEEPDKAAATRLRAEIDQLLRFFDKDGKQIVAYQREQIRSSMQNQIAEKYAETVVDKRENEAAGLRLKQRAEKLKAARTSSQEDDSEWYTRRAFSARAHAVAARILDLQKQEGKSSEVARLRAELGRLAPQGTSADVDEYLRWEETLAKWGRPTNSPREYYMRQGDPLISIDAPADAQKVVALLPGGDVKTLVYDAASKQWQVRFDIPTYAVEGPYTITIVIVHRDGTRHQFVLRYNVDVTAPGGTGRAAQVEAVTTNALRLELEASADTTRVTALLPWGDKVEMSPSAGQTNRFLKLVPVPGKWQNRELAVTYILTDKAHNRTTLRVDMSK